MLAHIGGSDAIVMAFGYVVSFGLGYLSRWMIERKPKVPHYDGLHALGLSGIPFHGTESQIPPGFGKA